MNWPAFTLCVPYFNQPAMLREHIRHWEEYPEHVRIIVVDDGSADPAAPVIKWGASDDLRDRLALYRIDVDIPWNRGGARNLATTEAETDWIVHIDIDHTLSVEEVLDLEHVEVEPERWYRFERYRQGEADETRNKDAIPREQKFGKIKPHIDSYLVTRKLYWKAGGYNESFSGCLGGGSPFLGELTKEGGEPEVLPIALTVHTRHSIADANTPALSRDRTEYARRKAAMGGNVRSDKRLRFPWHRVM